MSWTTAAFLALCLALGGGTKAGFAGDGILQLLAIPLLLVTVTQAWTLRPAPGMTTALAFASAIVLVPLLQLVPLPPSLWTHLPGRASEVVALTAAGVPITWQPVTVSAQLTWLSVLSLLPPLAVLFATLVATPSERARIAAVVIGMGALSALVGLAQVAGGPSSPLYFYSETNTSEAVGFFANRNHLAALLYSVLLFTAAWAADAFARVGNNLVVADEKSAGILSVSIAALLIILLLSTIAMARSRAGLLLTLVAVPAVVVLGRSGSRAESAGRRLFQLALAVALLLIVEFALYRIAQRLGSDPLEDLRITFGRNAWVAAMAFLPLGSGLGTFVPVYQLFEPAQDLMVNTYANQAHNDWLQLLLEAGFPGAFVLAAFLVWLGASVRRVWTARSHDGSAPDLGLARASLLAIVLVLLHSFVDYPLRTTAMMSVLAFAAALLIPAPRSDPQRAVVSLPRDDPSAALIRARALQHPPPEIEWPSSTKPVSVEPERVYVAKPTPPVAAKTAETAWPEEWTRRDGKVPPPPESEATADSASGAPPTPDESPAGSAES